MKLSQKLSLTFAAVSQIALASSAFAAPSTFTAQVAFGESYSGVVGQLASLCMLNVRDKKSGAFTAQLAALEDIQISGGVVYRPDRPNEPTGFEGTALCVYK